MCEHTENLTSYLLRGLQKDCKSLYPDCVADIDKFFRTVRFLAESTSGTLELCAIGKAIETSVITDQPLMLPFGVCNTKRSSTLLPDLGFFLFSRVFHVVTCQPLVGLVNRGRDRRYYFFEPEQLSCEKTYCNTLPREVVDPVSLALFLLRQVFLLISKATDIEVVAKEDDEVEQFRARLTRSYDGSLDRHVLQSARLYLSRLFLDDEDRLHPSLAQWESNPAGAHGPGAVYDGSRGKEKWDFARSFTATATYREFVNESHTIDGVEPSVSRLCIVPKDFRKHRLICIEQKEMMFYQQGLRRVIEDICSHDPNVSRTVSFTDQSLNYRLSKKSGYSTIDLSDASDLVHRRLVKDLFPRSVYKLLVNGRSSRIELPCGTVLDTYGTMYTMGNALCFTVESLVFSALVCAAICTYSGAGIKRASSWFRVFGDDIIVKSEYYDCVLDALIRAGLVPNRSKCCHNSLVRESCGSWFYHDYDLRITRPKVTQVTCDGDWVASLQIAMNLSLAGLYSTAMELLIFINRYYPVPFGYFGLPGDRDLTKASFLNKKRLYRVNFQLNREEFWMPTSVVSGKSFLEGRKGLYAFFTHQATAFTSCQTTTRSWTALK